MHIPNFSFLAQFGGQLCEEQTQKIRRPGQTTTSEGLSGGDMGLKSRDPQKVHLGHLLNVHTCFQLPSSIWRAVIRGTNSKNKKKRPKNHFLGAVRG